MTEAPAPVTLTAAGELRAAADHIEAAFPRAAEVLRALALPSPDPRSIRRVVLRQLWRRHFFGVARTTAARLLAAAWAEWEPHDEAELPGTLGEGFARLARLGVAPLQWRQIADDLDPTL